MANYIYRVANHQDRAEVFKIFEEVASEVPTVINEGTAGLVEEWIATGGSWVAIDSTGTIVGYALAGTNNGETSLGYLGVSKVARGQHVSSTLISKLQEVGAPIITDVRTNNENSMVERFEYLGFVKCAPDVFSKDRTKLRWDPS